MDRARALFLVLMVVGLATSLDHLRPSPKGSLPYPVGFCSDSASPKTAPSPDLYCVELIPIPDLRSVSGVVELGRVRAPFGVTVSPEGYHVFNATMTLEDLPDPATLGPFSTYVAWITTPRLRPFVKLGKVENGQTELGKVWYNQFLILVTAEASADVEDRRGRIVLRGTSPSTRAQAHPFVMLPPGPLPVPIAADSENVAVGQTSWHRPPSHPMVPMLPAFSGLRPGVAPFLPGWSVAGSIPEARPRQLARLGDGDTLDLEAVFVRRTINGRTFTMYGFNGQYPGPLILVPQAATITVNFTNHIDLATSVHWHGVRVDNRFDGVPGVTQDPVPPGGTFQYQVYFRDAGIYWYHPHHREDIQQDLGLYGNMLVRSQEPGYYSTVNREEVLMLDDLLIGDQGLVPYGMETATHALMGRFGNVFLVNGEPKYELNVKKGEVVRFFLTDVSNTRTFNLSFEGAPVKVVGSDLGKFEWEEWVENIVISPAERYIVEVQFNEPGETALTNNVQGLIHIYGIFFPEVDTLGVIHVSSQSTQNDYSASFKSLRENTDVVSDIDRYRPYFGRPVDHELVLTLEASGLPFAIAQMMRLDSTYFGPVEWSGTMPMMNWVSTGNEVKWILRDPATGKENMDIHWSFKQGDVVKIRLMNERHAIHAMQHPIHIHGQRFLILSQDGVSNDNLVWKDTMLLPVGSTADILLELSNPGRWMLHCHIAEHLDSGMKMVFEVDGVR